MLIDEFLESLKAAATGTHLTGPKTCHVSSQRLLGCEQVTQCPPSCVPLQALWVARASEVGSGSRHFCKLLVLHVHFIHQAMGRKVERVPGSQPEPSQKRHPESFLGRSTANPVEPEAGTSKDYSISLRDPMQPRIQRSRHHRT